MLIFTLTQAFSDGNNNPIVPSRTSPPLQLCPNNRCSNYDGTPNSIGVCFNDILEWRSGGVSSTASHSQEPRTSGQLVWRTFRVILTRARAERVGDKTKSSGDRLIARGWRCLDHEYNPLHRMALFVRGASWQDGRLSPSGLGRCPTARPPRRSLAALSSSNHGYQVPAMSRRRPLIVECGHRSHESREGDIERHTSQGRIWFRQRYPHHDKSVFPSHPP
jgi:hypothetical protein